MSISQVMRAVFPPTFRQLGILALDGSSSMLARTADRMTKADAVEAAVKDLVAPTQT